LPLLSTNAEVKVGVAARAVRRYFGSRLGDGSYASVVVERRIDWR
jgi:hypothetical protein